MGTRLVLPRDWCEHPSKYVTGVKGSNAASLTSVLTHKANHHKTSSSSRPRFTAPCVASKRRHQSVVEDRGAILVGYRCRRRETPECACRRAGHAVHGKYGRLFEVRFCAVWVLLPAPSAPRGNLWSTYDAGVVYPQRWPL